jgi:hypothetical protein
LYLYCTTTDLGDAVSIPMVITACSYDNRSLDTLTAIGSSQNEEANYF